MNNLELLIEQLMNEAYLNEAAQSFTGTVNEIMLCLALSGNDWSKIGNKEIQQILDVAKTKITPADLKDQENKASLMAKDILGWKNSNGYEESIQQVWWTGQDKQMLSDITKRDVNWKKNPSDILLDFGQGKFLGISAKSYKSSGDITLKSLGRGTVEKLLSLDFHYIVAPAEHQAVTKYNLPKPVGQRKTAINKDPKIKQEISAIALKINREIRNMSIKRLSGFSQEDARKHIISDWLDADGPDPYYLRAVGIGTKGKYETSVEDPIKNEKFKLISNGQIAFIPLANTSIGIAADNKPIFQIRFKYVDGNLSSSIGALGDSWDGKVISPEEEALNEYSEEEDSEDDDMGMRRSVIFLS